MERLPIFDEWMRDPEFEALPLDAKQGILTNYFESEMADDEFRGLDEPTQREVRKNFLSSHLGPVRMPGEVYPEIEQPKPDTEYHLKGAVKRIPYDVGSAMGGALPHGIGILGENAREYSDALAQQPEGEPYQPPGFPASRPPVSDGAQASPAIPVEQFSPERTQAKAQQLWEGLKTVGQENKDFYRQKMMADPDVKAFMDSTAKGTESIFTEAVGSLGPTMSGVLTSFIPAVGTILTGAMFLDLNKDEIYDQTKPRLLQQGMSEEEAEKKAQAVSWTGGAINSLLDTFGAEFIAGAVTKPVKRKFLQFLAGVGATSLAEGGTEGTQGVIGKISEEWAAKPAGETTDQFAARMLDKSPELWETFKHDAAIGAMIGGGMQTAIAGPRTIFSEKEPPTSNPSINDALKKGAEAAAKTDPARRRFEAYLNSGQMTREGLERMRGALNDDHPVAQDIDRMLDQMRQDEQPIELTDVYSTLPAPYKPEATPLRPISAPPRIAGELPMPAEPQIPDWRPGTGEVQVPYPGQERLPEPQRQLPQPKYGQVMGVAEDHPETLPGIPPLSRKSAKESAEAIEEAFGTEDRIRQSAAYASQLREQLRNKEDVSDTVNMKGRTPYIQRWIEQLRGGQKGEKAWLDADYDSSDRRVIGFKADIPDWFREGQEKYGWDRFKAADALEEGLTGKPFEPSEKGAGKQAMWEDALVAAEEARNNDYINYAAEIEQNPELISGMGLEEYRLMLEILENEKLHTGPITEAAAAFREQVEGEAVRAVSEELGISEEEFRSILENPDVPDVDLGRAWEELSEQDRNFIEQWDRERDELKRRKKGPEVEKAPEKPIAEGAVPESELEATPVEAKKKPGETEIKRELSAIKDDLNNAIAELKSGNDGPMRSVIREAGNDIQVEAIRRVLDQNGYNADRYLPETPYSKDYKKVTPSVDEWDEKVIDVEPEPVSPKETGKPPVEAKGKEPWEMSRAEYLDYSAKETGLSPGHKIAAAMPSAKEHWELAHRKIVQQAISEGKITSHPDYPDLAAKATAKEHPDVDLLSELKSILKTEQAATPEGRAELIASGLAREGKGKKEGKLVLTSAGLKELSRLNKGPTMAEVAGEQPQPVDNRALYDEAQEIMRALPSNIGKAKEDGRLSKSQLEALDRLEEIERIFPSTSPEWQAIHAENRQKYDADLKKWRDERRKEGQAVLQKHGFKVGDKVTRFAPSMLGMGGLTVKGVVKVDINGTPYVSSKYQKGKLSLDGWKKAEAAAEKPSPEEIEFEVHSLETGEKSTLSIPSNVPEYGSANKIFTKDAAGKARELLRKKLGQVSMGLDPELVQAGIQLAGYHIEAGARSFAAYSKAMVKDLGETVKPYLRGWYEAVRYYPGFDTVGMTEAGKIGTEPTQEVEAKSQPTKVQASQSVAKWVSERLFDGQTPIAWQELFAKADEAFGGTQAEGIYTPKDAYDAMEMGVNQYVLDHPEAYDPRRDARDSEWTVKGLKSRANKLLPTQSKRTAEQDEFQQFSTPPPHAYVVAWAANIGPEDVVIEPSAGVGGIAVFARNAGAKAVYVNEFSPRRADLLDSMGFDRVFRENAEQLNNVLPKDVRPSVVLMNPPFSSTAGRMQGKRSTQNAIRHIEQALERLEPNGRLVAIVGKGMRDDAPAFKEWWDKIKERYTVRANIGIDGQEYAKYGTTFDQQIIIIDKTGKTDYNTITGEVDAVEGLLPLLQGVRNERKPPESSQKAEPEGAEPVVGKPAPKGKADARPRTASLFPVGAVGSGQGGGGAVEAGAGGMAGRPAEPVEPKKSDEPPGGRGGLYPESKGGQKRPGGRSGPDTGSTGQPVGGEGERISGTSPSEELQIEAAQREARGEITEGLYEGYKPEKITISNAKRHPTPLVQSSAMAAVSPPTPSYKPKISPLSVSSGRISDIQLEAVVYAGQAHSDVLPDGTRRGFFIGDGTGVGKGREIAAIFWDNWNQGRTKGVWLSEKKTLFKDAQRDVEGVGWNHERVVDHGKIKATAPITAKKGILLTTYDTLKSTSKKDPTAKSRLDQIVEWLGEDFDGVIAFDESHNMGNAISVKGQRGATKPSQKALAGIEIQKRLPNARVVYVSATGATDVVNLAYCDRLGLWGEGTPFPNRRQFIQSISQGGMATMEMVAQNMKADGVYMARSLSYDGVEYERAEHPLTQAQRTIYDKLCEGWQTVLQNINEALEITGANLNGAAKSAAMSAFWGGHQRFFNQIITSMQTPPVIRQIHKDLDNGDAVVIQLVNTMEASQERAIAKLADEDSLEDLDLTPRDTLMQLVQNSFPVYAYEEYTDENDNIRSRPVLDSEKNPVVDAQAVAMRDQLLDEMGSIKVPDSPIDMILNEFGSDNVAEITGRKRRVVRKSTPKGEELVIEKRGKLAITAEAEAFMSGHRKILIFSEAGGTGRSYHADMGTKNQKKRVHYLLQAGWRADKAVQGLGRTHRSNQKQPPKYILVTTDLKGQKRFLSSIARRLDQLGALTKGQRETGSQGIFQARDNLESDYAIDALRRLYEDLVSNKLEGFTVNDFEQQTGLKIVDDHGNMVQQLPPIRQFLNRLLSMKIDKQNQLFDAFSERMDVVIQAHVDAGTLDQGVETLKAKKISKVTDQVVYTNPRSGATTKYVQLDLEQNTAFIPYDLAKRMGTKIVANKKSGKIWTAKLRSETNTRTGDIEDVWNLVSPTDTRQKIKDYDFDKDKWTEIKGKDAQKAWEQAIEDAPKTYTQSRHMVTGLLLPVWDRLIGWPRLVRAQTAEGERMIGRLIAPSDLARTLKKLGASQKGPVAAPSDIHANIIDRGFKVELANGWTLSRRVVSGDPRIEIKGPNFADEEIIFKYGVFKERIAWETRYFIPADESGINTISKIVTNSPVVDMVGPEGGGAQMQMAPARSSRTVHTTTLPDSLSNDIAMGTLGKLKSEPGTQENADYRRGKYHGDVEAADRVVLRTLNKKKLKELEKILDPQKPVLFVPVVNSEKNGQLNVLPHRYARQLAKIFGGHYHEDIVKTSGKPNTNAPLEERITKEIAFDGFLPEGDCQVVIVDDNYTSGKTTMALLGHLQSLGADVKAVTTLAFSARNGAQIKPTVNQLDKVREYAKMDPESKGRNIDDYIREVTGHDITQFTGAEAKALTRDTRKAFKSRYAKGNVQGGHEEGASTPPRLFQNATTPSLQIARLREAHPEKLDQLRADVYGWLKDVLPKVALDRMAVELTPEITATPHPESTRQHAELPGKRSGEAMGAATVGDLHAFIQLSYNFADSTMEETAYHEAFHVASRWLLPGKDLKLVLDHFNGNEEAAANAFSAFCRKQKIEGAQPVPGKIQMIFYKLKRLLSRVRDALQGKGFRRPEDVFAGLFEGRYGMLPESVRKGRVRGLALDVNEFAQPARMSMEKAASKIKGMAAFKKWFGDSKVVDENGEPVVVYHGSPQKEITDFYPGTYFTTNPKDAEGFGDTIYPVYISIKNPTYDSGMSRGEAIRKGYDGQIIKLKDGHTRVIAFRPENIKSIYNTGTWDATNPDIRLQMAGERAATADKGLLAQAKDMQAKGASRQEVWDKTGWWEIVPGSGTWAFEIDDSKVKFKIPAKEWKGMTALTKLTLQDVINAPDLFKAYPFLEDMDVQKYGLASMFGGTLGAWSTESNDIKLDFDLGVKKARWVVLHEIQHAIQEHEGFARGGSPGTVTVGDALSKQESEELDKFTSRMDDLSFEGYEWDSPEMKAVRDEMDAYTESKLKDKFGEDFGMGFYNRLTGEAEARLVQKRRDMTPTERKAEPPWVTLDAMLKDEGLLKEGQKVEDVLISRREGGTAALTSQKGERPDLLVKDFNIKEIGNARFMYNPKTDEMIIGGNDISRSSHAQEHFLSGAKGAFDDFVRGWVGISKAYPEGIIHFSPDVRPGDEEYGDALKTLDKFKKHGANDKTILRHLGIMGERPVSEFEKFRAGEQPRFSMAPRRTEEEMLAEFNRVMDELMPTKTETETEAKTRIKEADKTFDSIHQALTNRFGKGYVKKDMRWYHAAFGLPYWLGKKFQSVGDAVQIEVNAAESRSRELFNDYNGDLGDIQNDLPKDEAAMQEFENLIWKWDRKPFPKKAVPAKWHKEPVEGEDLEVNPEHYEQVEAFLKSTGASDKAVHAFLTIRKKLDEKFIDIDKTMRVEIDDPELITQYRSEINKVHNYFPHRRTGGSHVTIIDKRRPQGDKTVYREHYNTLKDRILPTGKKAKAKAKEWLENEIREGRLIGPVSDYVISQGPVEQLPDEVFFQIPVEAMQQIVQEAGRNLERERAGYEAERLFNKEGRSPEEALELAKKRLHADMEAALSKAVAGVFKGRGWASHSLFSKNIPGHETEDIFGILFDYLSGYAGFKTKIQRARLHSENMRGLNAKKSPQEYRYLSRYVKDMLTNQDKVDRAVDTLRGAFFVKYLGFVIKSGLVNLTQNIVLAAPVLSEHTKGSTFKLSRAMVDTRRALTSKEAWTRKGPVEYPGLTQDEQAALHELVESGTSTDQYLRELKGNMPGVGWGKVFKKAVDKSGIFMGLAERFNRTSTGLAAYRVARNEKGMDHDDAVKFAKQLIYDSHFLYGQANYPSFVRGGDLQKAIRSGYTFRTFTHNYLSAISHMMANQQKAVVARSLRNIFLVGGLTSIPLFELAAKALYWAMGDDDDDPLTDARSLMPSQWLKDLITYGLPGVAGVDLSGSLSIEIPRSWKDLIGVPYSVGEDTVNTISSLRSGAYFRALSETPITPIAVRNAMRGYELYTEGQRTRGGKDINYFGETGPHKISGKEAIQKGLLGLQPTSVSSGYKAYEATNKTIEAMKDKKTRLVDRAANAVRRKDKAEIAKIGKEIDDWNQNVIKTKQWHEWIDVDEALLRRLTPGATNVPTMIRPRAAEISKEWRRIGGAGR